jgi:hypothetical protein
MKSLLLLLLVLLLPCQSKNIELDYQDRLNQNLINSSELPVQLFSMLSRTPIDLVKAKSILNKALNKPATKYTLFLTDTICHKYSEFTNWCHQQKIHNKHITTDPENIFSYLFKLSDIVNEKETTQILNKAALMGHYSDEYYFDYIPKLQTAIEAFNKSNKALTTSFLKIRNKKYRALKYELAKKQPYEHDLLNLINFKEQSNSLQHIITVKMANTFSSNHIKKACANRGNYAACLKISEILQKDKTVINYIFGINLKIDRLKTKKSTRNESLKTLKSNRIDDFLCHMNPTVSLFYTYDMKTLANYLFIAKQNDEFEAAKQTSLAVFKLLEQQGLKPNFNPKDCE